MTLSSCSAFPEDPRHHARGLETEGQVLGAESGLVDLGDHGNELDEIDLLGFDVIGPGLFHLRELNEIFDPQRQPIDVSPTDAHRPVSLVGEVPEFALVEQLEKPLERRERRPEFVGNVGHQIDLELIEGLQFQVGLTEPTDALLKIFGHVVERMRQLFDLVSRPNLHALVQATGANPPDPLLEIREVLRDLPRQGRWRPDRPRPGRAPAPRSSAADLAAVVCSPGHS